MAKRIPYSEGSLQTCKKKKKYLTVGMMLFQMYSGFFQHVIHSCLLDVEKLFEAMGYNRVSDDLLVLDGPICPDQVANVSRDAMAAYVELQILKQILGGLNDLGLSCSWLEIYRYRESHVCEYRNFFKI